MKKHISDSVHEGSGHMVPKDYTNYLIFINVYMIALIAIFFFFFSTDYKRSQVLVCSAL